MSSIVLFDDKKDCCGCGACMNVCPKNAIRMAEDEVGFVYPEIDQICVLDAVPAKRLAAIKCSL